MHILFVQVGGTIDKDYPQGETHHGYEFQIGEPAILSIMARAKCAHEWSHLPVLRKDSLDISDADRARVREMIDASGKEKIIVTHGTDTIHKTAEALSELQGKTIVLTGAMLPEKFRDSDADFNLGMAVGALQHLPPGVYIALYGQVLRWDEFVPR